MRRSVVICVLTVVTACASAAGPARLQLQGEPASVEARVHEGMVDLGFHRNPDGSYGRADEVTIDPEGTYWFVLADEDLDRRTEYRLWCSEPEDAGPGPTTLLATVWMRTQARDGGVELEVDPVFRLRAPSDAIASCTPDSGLARRIGHMAAGQE